MPNATNSICTEPDNVRSVIRPGFPTRHVPRGGRFRGAARGEKLFVKMSCFRFFNYSICIGQENGFEITFNYIIE